jgi:phosphoglycerate dehydrogenase-like enzyme
MSDRVTVLVARDALRDELGPLPQNIRLTVDPAPDVEVVVVDREHARRLPELFAALPRLRFVQSISAGVEWLLPLVPHGVTVSNASGVHDGPVSEWCVAAILALERRLPGFVGLQRERRWDANANDYTATGEPAFARGDDVEGKRVLILGHGSIGRALEARLRPFGADVVGIAKHARPGVHTPEALDGLLPQADVVVLLLPLTPETERLANGTFLDRMKQGALLVNAARGRLVDTDALLERLQAGRVRAALDVTDPEPLPDGHPLWSAPGLLVTPHIAGAPIRWRARAYRFVGDQLRRYAAGEPLRNVANAAAVGA